MPRSKETRLEKSIERRRKRLEAIHAIAIASNQERSLLNITYEKFLSLSNEEKMKYLEVAQRMDRAQLEICKILGCQRGNMHKAFQNEQERLQRDIQLLEQMQGDKINGGGKDESLV